MTIANKLGSDYESIRAASKLKTIKVNLNDIEFELKVRVPVKKELEAMMASIASPDKEYKEKLYEELSAPLRKSILEAGDDFLNVFNSEAEKIKFTDDDIVVDGNSIRNIAHMSAMWHTQVEKFFSLLQSATGEPINESFEQITDEFPDAVVKEIIEKIDAAIRPNYGESRKN
jgi:ribosomal protein S20